MQVKELISEYGKHLQQAIGVSESTRHQYIHYVQRFLSEKFTDVFQDKPINLQPSELIQYVIKQREHHHVPVLKSMLTALRSFLRYLQMKGLCEARLVNAIPSLPAWKLAGIPNYLTKEQLDKFLTSSDCETPTGRRDYAIALCLARLGLRRKEVACLTLDDIDWRSGILRITSSKSRRFSSLPLPEDLGKAIVSYLRDGRPPTEERRVFVCHRHRIGQPLQSAAIGTIIRRRFKRTGMEVSSRGTHILRHTVASHMVQKGVTIKEVADLLRHRSLDTTVIYTKINLPMLLEVALPWPKEGEIT
ncbi:tyrosine-type recombinase/integrase [Candidatus Bipolaricaulota bacterium]|nr:tyrosine-type recombinase/integrase [Candidatus Bipolaricaulota bacterium]